jgi:hypothetical protein
MGILLFYYTHGGEKIAFHDAIHTAFVSIARDVGFHVLRQQTRIFSSPFFQSFC